MKDCSLIGLETGTASALPDNKPRTSRKLAILKRTGLFSENTLGAEITQATTFEELRDAYHLVHRVYAETGFISRDPSELRLRVFEATKEMATFIARDKGRVVGVLSVIGDSKEFGLPSDGAFPEELETLRADGNGLCEVTNQAIDEKYRKSALPTELMRCAMAHGIKKGYRKAIATVSPGHTAFYNLLNFFEIGPVRSYSKEIHDPVIALCGDLDFYRKGPSGLDDAGEFVHSFMAGKSDGGNRFLELVEAWSASAEHFFESACLMRQLFVDESGFLEQCTESEREILKSKWGEDVFNAVLPPSLTFAASNWFDGLTEGILGFNNSPSFSFATAGS